MSSAVSPTSIPVTPQSSLLPNGVRGERLVEVNDLRVSFRKERLETTVVRGVSFSIYRGETLVIVGESGSGKSITARAILGLLPPTAAARGSVQFESKELIGMKPRDWREIRGSHIGIVFQDPSRALNPTTRVGRQVAEGMRWHFDLSREEAMKRAIEMLERVGIPFPKDRANDYPHQLSGGMRQRVMMAIALSCQPDVLIADEPTTALDVTIQAQIMELLRELQRDLNIGILLITHDMGLAFSYGDQIAVMYGGQIVEKAKAGELQSSVRMPYTAGLLSSVPRLADEAHSKFHALTGRPPDPSAFPIGCTFAPRCAYRQARCEEEQPVLVGTDGHEAACWFPL